MSWVKFETPGAVAHILDAIPVENLGNVGIFYSEAEELYSVIKYDSHTYYIWETNFYGLEDARKVLKG